LSGAAFFPKAPERLKYMSTQRGAIKSVEVGEEVLKRLNELANRSAIERYREIFEDRKCGG